MFALMGEIKPYRSKLSKPKKYTALTVSKLKRYPGLQNLSEIEAMQAIDAIEKLSNLLFYMLRNGEIFHYEKESAD
jgi:hypothetical protein